MEGLGKGSNLGQALLPEPLFPGCRGARLGMGQMQPLQDLPRWFEAP